MLSDNLTASQILQQYENHGFITVFARVLYLTLSQVRAFTSTLSYHISLRPISLSPPLMPRYSK
jgi:hypothetical protein